MKLSVIIPTFNRKETLKTTLLSLNSQTFKDFEVIVADDGSTDGTEGIIDTLTLSYPIKHLWQNNSGRSAARNMGLEKATGELILFIDDHIVVDRKLIEEHVKYHDRYKKDGVRVVRGLVTFIERPEDAPRSSEYVPESKIRSPKWENEPFRVFITNNISVEKKALLSVFGFDEDFKEYGLQDAETGYRLKAAGYKFKINPNAVGHIFGVGWTFEERCKRRRQVGRSSVLFYKKHPTPLVKINLSVHFITLMLQKLLSLFGDHLPKRSRMFYNFSTGVKEGLEKYKDERFKKFHSRFKADKKTILFVSHLSDLSGAPISLTLLASNIDKEKYHCVMALPSPGPITKKLDQAGINYQIFKDKPIYKIFPSLKLYQIMKDRQVELVYLNTSASIWAAKAAKLLRIPVISHIREDLRGPNNALIKLKVEFLSDRIILISNWMKSFMTSERSVVVHNSVDLSDFNDLHPEKIRTEFNIRGPLVTFIGSLEERKGIKYFIKAYPKTKTSFPSLKFLIVGAPLPGQKNQVEALRRLVKDPNLRFTGSRSDVYDIMAASDIIVVPSLSEPFGRVVIEGMACRRPVIATDVGGIPEIVVNSKTGILIKPRSLDAISREVTLLLKNRDKMKTMGELGRKRVEEYFTMATQIAKVESIIDGLINK